MLTVLIDVHHDTGAIDRIAVPAERASDRLVVHAGELAKSAQIAVVAGVLASADEPPIEPPIVWVDLDYTLPRRARVSRGNRVGVKVAVE